MEVQYYKYDNNFIFRQVIVLNLQCIDLNISHVYVAIHVCKVLVLIFLAFLTYGVPGGVGDLYIP